MDDKGGYPENDPAAVSAITRILSEELAGSETTAALLPPAHNELRRLAAIRAYPPNMDISFIEVPLGRVAIAGLALSHIEQGKYEPAEAFLDEEQALLNQRQRLTTPQTSPAIAQNLNAYARLYLARKKYIQAVAYLKRVLGIWGKVHGPYRRDMTGTLEITAEFYRATGRDKEAEALEKRAVNISVGTDTHSSPSPRKSE